MDAVMEPPWDLTADRAAGVPRPTRKARHFAQNRAPVALGRCPEVTVKHSALSTIPTAEKPALSDEQRADRLRLRRPDGLDRETLKHVEQLTDAER